jgi:8-oxo-dGTP pyrophosphatase MutT (NUDIX family)
LVWNLLREWTDRLRLRAGGPGVAKQAGAIPYTVVDEQVVFLLVTSRGSGRWIFPKGEPIEGLEPWQVAAQEASEEAGIEGEVDRIPLGSYRTFKTMAFRRKIVDVAMYPLRVTRQRDDWPEKKHRHRHWAILPEAKRLLTDPQLAELTVKLNQRVRLQPSFKSQLPIERISQ